MQRLTEEQKDLLAEYTEKLYLKNYHTYPRINYTPIGINMILHLHPAIVHINIYKTNFLFTIDYTKYYNYIDRDEEPLKETYYFDDIDEVYDFITYIIDTIKPPKIYL